MARSSSRGPIWVFAGKSRRADPAVGNLDEIRFQDALLRNVDLEKKRRIPTGCTLYLRGWVFTSEPHAPASETFALIGGDVAFPIAYGDVRWDIVPHYDDPKLERVGFRGIYPLSGLPLGSYDIRIAAFVPDSDEYQILETGERFQVVESRYLFPGTRVASPGAIELSVDSIETYGGRQPQRGSLSVRGAETVVIKGWAVDREQSTAAGGIFALIDGKEYVGGVHGLPRHDVALSLDMFDARRCGFTVRVPMHGLGSGSHKLQIIALAADGLSYSVSDGVKLAVASG